MSTEVGSHTTLWGDRAVRDRGVLPRPARQRAGPLCLQQTPRLISCTFSGNFRDSTVFPRHLDTVSHAVTKQQEESPPEDPTCPLPTSPWSCGRGGCCGRAETIVDVLTVPKDFRDGGGGPGATLCYRSWGHGLTLTILTLPFNFLQLRTDLNMQTI